MVGVAVQRRSLARESQSTYVKGADGYYSRLCRVQPPGAAPEPSRALKKIPASLRPLPGQRSARRATSRVVLSPSGGRSQEYLTQGPPMAASPDTGTPPGCELRRFGASALAPPSQQQETRRPLAANVFHTGRRVMRQTMLPTEPQGRPARMRSDCSTSRLAPLEIGSQRRSQSRFGLPLTPESGGPSRQSSVPSALTTIRDRRRQELQNAEQNVDRCHTPGRDPGRRGPRQSRRRI
jgi:hypothetical protein